VRLHPRQGGGETEGVKETREEGRSNQSILPANNKFCAHSYHEHFTPSLSLPLCRQVDFLLITPGTLYKHLVRSFPSSTLPSSFLPSLRSSCVRPSLLRSLLPWDETAEGTLVEVRLEDCRVVCLIACNESVVSNDATAESIHD